MRCIACGCSELEAEGFKCAQCGGAPGVRAEQCYVTEETKAQLLAQASKLENYGLTAQREVFYKETLLTLQQADHAAESARRAGRGEFGTLTLAFCGVATNGFLPRRPTQTFSLRN